MKFLLSIALLIFSFLASAQEGLNFEKLSAKKPVELKFKAQRESFVALNFRAIADSAAYPIPLKLTLYMGGDTVNLYRAIADSLEQELFSIKLSRGEQVQVHVSLYDVSRKQIELAKGVVYFYNKEENSDFHKNQAKLYHEWEDDFWRAGDQIVFDLNIDENFKGANLVVGLREDYIYEDLSLLLKLQKGRNEQLQRVNAKVQDAQVEFKKKVIRFSLDELNELPEGTYQLIIDQLETGFLLYGVDFIAIEMNN